MITPSGFRFIVELEDDFKQQGSLVIQQGDEDNYVGKVLRAGYGANANMVGRRILFPKKKARIVLIEGDKYAIVKQKFVLGAFDDAETNSE